MVRPWRSGHALLFTAAELARQVFGPGGEAEFLEPGHSGRFGFGFASATDEGRQHGVLQRIELRQELVELEDEADVGVAEPGECLVPQPCYLDAVDDHRPAVGAVEGGEHVEQGRLARARGSDDGDDLAAGERHVHATEDLEVAVGLVDSGRMEHVRKLTPKANFAAPNPA